MRTITFVSRKIATIAALVVLAAPARATTIVGMTERMLARSADAIVIGTVRGIETVGRPDGAIHTLVTLDVERAVKGTVGRRVTLKQAGGRVGDRLLWIAGSPTFAVGQRQLVFLSAGHDGAARTTALGMGQFVLRPHARTGATMAERRVDATVLGRRPVRRVSLARLLRTIARATAGEAPRAAVASAPAEATDPGLTRTTVDEFRSLADPPARWFEPDTSQPVVYDVDPAGDNDLGVTSSLSALDGAFATWTNVTGASIVLQRGGSADPAPLICDGLSQIVFNDPFNEMPAPVACSGVLALGGYCSSGSTTVVNGTTFYRITEGNITFNKGFGGCSFWNTTNLAEVATHEVGHTIGLGHSSESDSASPELLDATMYYRAHFDGRGAAVRADDIAGVRFFYPGPGGGDPNVDDSDADGWVDAQDNCAGVANAAQTDTDADGAGDLCDPCPLLPEGTEVCQAISLSKLRVKSGRRHTRLVWKGFVSLPVGTPPAEARALVVNGFGVVVDTASGAIVPRSAGRLRSETEAAVITLKQTPTGEYRVRVVADDVALGAESVPFMSANLQVTGTTFSDALTCYRRGRKLRCRG